MFNWDAATGRLTDMAATNKITPASGDTDLGTTRYTYDPAGRITEREQAYTTRPSSPGDSQCYSYDYADRIAAVWTPANLACGTAPASTATSVAGLGGPAPYAQTYTYTAAGDRSQVKRFGSNGALAVTETYAYPTPGTVGPHRVQSVTSVAGSTTTPQSFTWDAAGRMTGRAGQTLTYTLDGRLDSSTGTSTVPANPNPNATAGTSPAPTTGAGSFGARYYDAAGNLVGITDGTGTTLTLGAITAHSTPGGVKTATKTYTFAGKVVAQRATAGAGTTKLALIIGDSINTAQTMTLPNTSTGTQMTALVRRTDPLGLARGSNSTGAGNNAFTTAAVTTAGTGSNAANAAGFGAVNGYIAGLDDTVSALTHLGARDMDPALGVFTAPDPILNTEDQRGFTPYTYAFGNVINATDPSGLAIQRPLLESEGSGLGPATQAEIEDIYKGGDLLTLLLAQNPGSSLGIDNSGPFIDANYFNKRNNWGTWKNSIAGDQLNHKFTSPSEETENRWNAVSNAFDLFTTITPMGAATVPSKLRFIFKAENIGKAALRTPEVIRVMDVKLPGVPKAAVGTPVTTGKGLEYAIPRGTPELHPNVVSVRIMDPVTSGRYQHPNGYAVYMNKEGQSISPFSGETVSNADPLSHIDFPK